MFEYFEAEKAKKKALTAQEKKEAKKAKDDMELKYITCLLDGRKEKVGNFRVEPPGLFRGRGDHPRKGALKVYSIKVVSSSSDQMSSSVCDQRTSPSILEKMRPSPCPICPETGRVLHTTTPSPGLPIGQRM